MGYATVLNVVDDFGAKGNGTHDDTTAINNALMAVPDGPPQNPSVGAWVYFPAGDYLISAPLIRRVNFTRCIGAGKRATRISVDASSWSNFISPADPTKGFVFDLEAGVTDGAVMDLQINGNAGQMMNPALDLAGGIFCTAREQVERVSFYDIWGWSVWLVPSGLYSRVIDCDADLGSDYEGDHGNDCIGGAPVRATIVRFYWMPTLDKNTALDVTNAGGGAECSLDLEDCSNESGRDILLEGCSHSRIVRCRFALPRGSTGFSNTLLIQSDAAYVKHTTITNPLDILVADNVFAGAALIVAFDGGITKPPTDPRTTLPGGRVAIMRNAIDGSPHSGITWMGDDESTSLGGSVITGNRISNPNQNGDQTPIVMPGAFEPLGTLIGSGISVLSSYGMVISHNTIDDTTGEMVYSMQLVRQDKAEPAPTERILIKDNLCGHAPGQGNGNTATFYYDNGFASGSNPLPILESNTNQAIGYDDPASEAITNGVPWPPAKDYPYDAFVSVIGGDVTSILIGAEATGFVYGNFYVPAGQTITISWNTTRPSIRVFRS